MVATVFCGEYFCDDPATWYDVGCVALCGAVCDQFGGFSGVICAGGCGAACGEVLDGIVISASG